MPSSTAIDPSDRAHPAAPPEPYLHFLAREGQLVFRVLLFLSLAATVALMVTIFYLAIIPALFAVGCFVMLFLADRAEESTRDPAAPPPRDWADGPLPGEAAAPVDGRDQQQQREVTKAVHHRLTRVGIEVVGAAIIISVVMCGLTFGWDKLAIGGLFFFGYIILLTTPVWLGWMEEEAEDEVLAHEKEKHS